MYLLMAIKSARLNVNRFWPTELTITQAAEDTGLNSRTLTNIRKGTERGEWITLFKLAEYLSKKTDQKISLEDLFEVERD